jgi:hypothetical protein
MSLIGLGLMLQTGASIQGFLGGRATAKDALQGLEEFEPQDLINPFETLTPSFQVEQTALDELSEARAGAFDVASGMDASSALAIASNVVESTTEQQGKLINRMIDKQFEADVLEAQDDARIRAVQEQRDRDVVASLQEQLLAGRQEQASAVQGLIDSTLAVGLSREKRIAGLGIDPIQARIDKITKLRNSGEEISLADKLFLRSYGLD